MSTDEPQHTLFELIEAPALRDPVLILALEGWIDAAGATRAARQLLVEVGAGRRLARFDTDRLLDHRARRPTLRLVDGVASGLVWPNLELSLLEGIDGAELLLLHGPEPDHEWKAFAAAVGSLGRRLGISMVVGLGAYPAAVPHTRPTRLSCTAGSSEMATRLDRKDGAEIKRRKDGAWQSGQSCNGPSLSFCNASSSCPQDSHRYSYMGIPSPRLPERVRY